VTARVFANKCGWTTDDGRQNSVSSFCFISLLQSDKTQNDYTSVDSEQINQTESAISIIC
jgi:hypothetical protein